MEPILSFGGLCFFLALGKFLRVKIPLLRRFYIPSSVIGGFAGLAVIQLLAPSWTSSWTMGWSALPGFLINIVFAALFLGVRLPTWKSLWQQAGPQVVFGQILAWGQYVVGLGVVLFFLIPLLNISPFYGILIEVGFEGGHGTAAGLASTFTDLGWREGSDLALTMATGGLLFGVLIGMALINWGARRGHLNGGRKFTPQLENETGLYPVNHRPSAGAQTSSADSIDSLALHLAVLGTAILVGVGLKFILVGIEQQIPAAARFGLFKSFPLFPLCMIGGLIVQLVLDRTAETSPIDHTLMQRLSGTALDFLVVAAISTIRIEVIQEGWLPLTVLFVAGTLWNVGCVLWLAPRIFKTAWFERAIAEFGQSMGVTATGLLLLRAVDPENKTEATASFGYKQLAHEPFMGGGLWTSSAVLLVAAWGGGTVFAVSLSAVILWMGIAWFLFLRRRPHEK